MTFGERFKEARAKAGFTQDELAQYFVLLTDEQMISRALAKRITDKKFEIGDREFLVMGKVD